MTSLSHVYVEGSSDTALVILHGFGANKHNLAPLSQWLDPQKEHHWYFPDGPLTLGFPYDASAKAWATLDFEGYDKAMRENRFRSYLSSNSDRLLPPTQSMREWLEPLIKKHAKIIIGGFSQGGMVAIELMLTFPSLFKGALLFSTTFAAEARWQTLISNLKPTFPVFLSHGILDGVLPISEAKALAEFFKQNGFKVDDYYFSGAHEIPMALFKPIQDFIKGAANFKTKNSV